MKSRAKAASFTIAIIVTCIALATAPAGAQQISQIDSQAQATSTVPQFDYRIPDVIYHNDYHNIKVLNPAGQPMANGYQVSVYWLIDGTTYRSNGTTAGGIAKVRMTFPINLSGKAAKMWVVGQENAQYPRVSTSAKNIKLGYPTSLHIEFWNGSLMADGGVTVHQTSRIPDGFSRHLDQKATVVIQVDGKKYTFTGDLGRIIWTKLPASAKGKTATITVSVTASPDAMFKSGTIPASQHVVK